MLRLSLFLSLFFGTFLICAGGVALRDSGQWLSHLRIPSFKNPSARAMPTRDYFKGLDLPKSSDWSKMTWSEQNFTMPKINVNVPPPALPPQIRMPYVPPPPTVFRR